MARILVLTPQLPYPPQQGTSLRNYHLLRALTQRHDVTLLSFAERDGPGDTARLGEIVRVLPPVPVPSRTTAQRLRQLLATRTADMALRLQSEELAAALRQALASDRYDAVQIEGIEMAWTMPLIREAAPGAKIVLDCHNAETELQRRTFRSDARRPVRWPAAVYSAIQIGRLERFERKALRAADARLAVSQEDAAILAHLLDGSLDPGVAVVPNTIDVDEYRWKGPVPDTTRFDLVFTGKMDYRPNVDGVLWFAESIWPLITARRPATTWAVVGQRPHPRLAAIRELPGVSVTGRVAGVQPYLAGAAVYVMPLRVGSGTRLKVIESMAAGCAVVATKVAVEGFPVRSGYEALLADAPEAFAAAVLELLAHPEQRAAMGRRAAAFAEGYDWRQVAPLLDKVYARMLGP